MICPSTQKHEDCPTKLRGFTGKTAVFVLVGDSQSRGNRTGNTKQNAYVSLLSAVTERNRPAPGREGHDYSPTTNYTVAPRRMRIEIAGRAPTEQLTKRSAGIQSSVVLVNVQW